MSEKRPLRLLELVFWLLFVFILLVGLVVFLVGSVGCNKPDEEITVTAIGYDIKTKLVDKQTVEVYYLLVSNDEVTGYVEVKKPILAKPDWLEQMSLEIGYFTILKNDLIPFEKWEE